MGNRDFVLSFSVRDTGIGIAPDKLDHIFDAFIQGDGSTTRRYSGTGLGLAISSSLAQMMGGRIAVESVLGSGTMFHATIRVGAAAADGAVKSAKSAAINLDRLMATIEGDIALRQQLVDLFVEDCARLRRELRVAIGARDAATVAAVAHRLKGSIGVFVTAGAFAEAARLEADGRDGNLDAAALHHKAFERELDALLGALATLKPEGLAA
jgi:HPt (histidine-containing phosphotransfer) domain-containing protein